MSSYNQGESVSSYNPGDSVSSYNQGGSVSSYNQGESVSSWKGTSVSSYTDPKTDDGEEVFVINSPPLVAPLTLEKDLLLL